ncbi:MarR family transcriptional regulator [Ktedonosporobacter rubrisoli]|uniref:MarR family transcriptional regulator n=1 Tax=Ktedonosporobacter rubrisoli TaxID=2509675 RepID=A0A4P6JNS8_KTERU|nr:MarR family transcriptional regulator [Ktedonosporobacter rubrisoli]QBD76905.1 MarR family transcriptional regulator [Ktedonosporobacter rubrisoli]
MTREQLIEDLFSLSRLLRPDRRQEMTPQQYWLLRHLRSAGPLKTGELARALGITMGTATEACQRLERAGLLTRQRQTNDERIVKIALTEEGIARIDALRQQKIDEVLQLLEVLDEQEQQELQRLVARLLATAEARGFRDERRQNIPRQTKE